MELPCTISIRASQSLHRISIPTWVGSRISGQEVDKRHDETATEVNQLGVVSTGFASILFPPYLGSTGNSCTVLRPQGGDP